jgi:putative Ca2+/H+ antiporter (TMEM165/GDT1 family)
MDWKLLATVFATTFLAELGDKTQLAVMTFTAGGKSPLAVFLGGSLALVLTTLLGVLVGAGLAKVIPAKVLHIAAAAGFVIIGILMLVNTLRAGGQG